MEFDEHLDQNMEGFLDQHPIYADLVESLSSICISNRFNKKEQIRHWLNEKNFSFNGYLQQKRGVSI